MTPLEYIDRIDQFSDQLKRLAAENRVVNRLIGLYALGKIETKEKALEMMVVALDGSEKNYHEELIRLRSWMPVTWVEVNGN